MMAFLEIRIRIATRFHKNAILNPSRHHRNLLLLCRSHQTSMSQAKCKRPICPSCSKPTRTCLCSRILTSGIENSVSVTILQHALETKHPLNSTRIARLGIKNLKVATVSDVNFEARFVIRLSEPDLASEIGETQKRIDDDVGNLLDLSDKAEICHYYPRLHSDSDCTVRNVHEDDNGRFIAISATISKNGVISSLSHIWMPMIHQPQKKNPSFCNILDCSEACESLSKGFWVKKFKRRTNLKDEECEFELEVPPGSALLFPSDKAVDINDIDAIGFRVKNLIVLDGTWAKARRVYSENPWLDILPHVKLKVKEMSLYSEVRHQPKAGYLSTIESIVHALRAVGENDEEGLENLLNAFESMVGDQRRCKEERVTKTSQI